MGRGAVRRENELETREELGFWGWGPENSRDWSAKRVPDFSDARIYRDSIWPIWGVVKGLCGVLAEDPDRVRDSAGLIDTCRQAFQGKRWRKIDWVSS